jgi:short-subunit dehydrogenase
MRPAEMVVVLTGAAGGIGRAMTLALVRAGARVLLVGRRPAPLVALAAEIGEPGRAQALVADITRREGRAAIRAAAAAQRANVLINNAGVPCFGALETLDEERIAAVLLTNLIAPIQLTHALLPQLRGRSEANVLNIGSVLGRLGLPGYTVYSAGKFGLRGFSESLRRELSATSVCVQYLGPRSTRTAFNDARVEAYNRATATRADAAERVAAAALAQLESRRPERFVGFPESLAVRLNGLAPHWLDRAFVKHAAVVAQPEPTAPTDAQRQTRPVT